MKKRIKFICLYDELDAKFKRKFILSATTKIDYIISVFNRLGIGVDMISAATAEGGKFSICKNSTHEISLNNNLTTFGGVSLPSKRLTWKLNEYIINKNLKIYLDKNINPGDIVLAYHSPRYARILTDLRKKREFTLIGEIEEIYQDVQSMGEQLDQQEYMFFDICDKFIFPTHLLNDKLNADGKKKNIIIHGLYNIQPSRNVTFGDGKVHVIYAGTFDPRKGGAAAAAAAAHLPENYHIHICGFGSQEATKRIAQIIEETNRHSKATVSYEGLLKGEEFISFIQKCEIGLSTQNPNAEFNSTSFPSKILNYLSNGLKVVTIDIPAISNSEVGKQLFYYKEQTPESIAKAIEKAHKKQGIDGRELLKMLDKKFENALADFLE